MVGWWLRIGAGLAGDVRYALRGLRNAPGYAVTVVLTLALGLGAVTAMLAIVDSVLLRPVSLPHPEQLAVLNVKGHDGSTYGVTYKQIDAIRRNVHSFSSASAFNFTASPVGVADGTRMTLQVQTSADFFQTLGVNARLGRVLSQKDEGAPIAVVSAWFWRDYLQSDPMAVGKTLRISGKLLTIVGVLPEGIHFPQGTEAPIVYTPLSLNAKSQDDIFGGSAWVITRVKPDVTLKQAQAEARSVFSHVETGSSARNETLALIPYGAYLTGDERPALWALLGGGGVLLLIACANAANLQIARATGRVAEMNVRSALGASFARLMQQVVTESVVVSLIGAAFGGGMALAMVHAVHESYGKQFPRFDEVAIHPATFLACALLAVLAGVLASLAPVLSIRKQTNANTTTLRTTRRSRVPGLLVALQIALTCVLLVMSGLFVRTFRALENVKLGFDPHGVTTLVLMPQNQHQDPEISRETITRLLDRFQNLPGVQSAAMQTAIPFSNFNMTLNGTTDISGRPFQDGDTAYYSMVSTNFVHASGIHLLRGRAFASGDDANGVPVALVNEAFVKKFMGGRDVMGVTVKSHHEPNDKDLDVPFLQPYTVVGVVENEVQGGDLGAAFEPMVYFDYRQLPKGSMLTQVFSFADEFSVRSTLPQDALDKELRAAIKQTAPDMTEMELQPMDDAIAGSLSQRKLALRLVSGFGGVALLLAAIGIYGVLAYSVAQRRKEIGIRMALGSSRAGATQLVMKHAGTMVMYGLVLGALATWPAGRAVQSFLFGVKTLDPWTMSAAGGVLLLVCAIAAAVPAWRAAQVDPMEALRAE